MKKIEFVNGHAPYLNEENLNQMQNNMEEVSVPEGGTQGQVLAKASNTDNDVEWTTLAPFPTGGTQGQALVKASIADNDVEWKTLETIPIGGTTNQVLSKASNTDNDTEWKSLNIPEFAVLTGTITIGSGSTGIGSTSVAFPDGFTKDNCVVISQMYKGPYTNINGRYISGYLSETDGQPHSLIVMLGKLDGTDDNHIYIQTEGPNASLSYPTLEYKIVLMKI